jgi:hypothetical protein
MFGHSPLRSFSRTVRRRLVPCRGSSWCETPCGSSPLSPPRTCCTGRSGAGCGCASQATYCCGTACRTRRAQRMGTLVFGVEVALILPLVGGEGVGMLNW